MKPYFTKWIPVEGEIKSGDRVKFQIVSGKTPWKLCTVEEVHYHAPNIGTIVIDDGFVHIHTNIEDCKKVKLFLCSRDIKVGDKDVHTGVMQDYGEEIVKEIKYEHQLEFMKGVSEANKTELFKIIGEVSPQAIWVKEGTEFEKSDLDTYGTTGEIFITAGGTDGYIKFKCPTCGTFH